MTSFPQKPVITNYQLVTKLIDAFPTKDPSSELPAVCMNQRSNDLTAVLQSAPMCRMQIVGTTGATPVITGSTTWTSGIFAGWQLPQNPTFVRNSTGNLTVTMPASVTDFLGNSGIPVNVTDVSVNVLGSTPLASASITINSSNQFTVILNTLTAGAFAPNDFVGQFITFKVY